MSLDSYLPSKNFDMILKWIIFIGDYMHLTQGLPPKLTGLISYCSPNVILKFLFNNLQPKLAHMQTLFHYLLTLH